MTKNMCTVCLLYNPWHVSQPQCQNFFLTTQSWDAVLIISSSIHHITVCMSQTTTANKHTRKKSNKTWLNGKMLAYWLQQCTFWVEGNKITKKKRSSSQSVVVKKPKSNNEFMNFWLHNAISKARLNFFFWVCTCKSNNSIDKTTPIGMRCIRPFKVKVVLTWNDEKTDNLKKKLGCW